MRSAFSGAAEEGENLSPNAMDEFGEGYGGDGGGGGGGGSDMVIGSTLDNFDFSSNDPEALRRQLQAQPGSLGVPPKSPLGLHIAPQSEAQTLADEHNSTIMRNLPAYEQRGPCPVPPSTMLSSFLSGQLPLSRVSYLVPHLSRWLSSSLLDRCGWSFSRARYKADRTGQHHGYRPWFPHP